MNKPIRKVVIAGGGTAGWASAAALSNNLKGLVAIVLVESDAISTVGVGEATVPPMQAFNKIAGIDEREFLSHVSGAFKLGIKFENWRKLNHEYIHSFGQLGKATWMAGFQHILFHAEAKGIDIDLADYCVELRAASQHKCYFDEKQRLNYAYHLDATAYAKWLRGICIKRGVTRIEGKITQVGQDPDDGFITSLTLENGTVIDGDFFIDCTGFSALLIEKTLHTGYENWSHWLPMNSAWATQALNPNPPAPYTKSTARSAGWQWTIPLQHRTGTGLVYSSDFISDQDALEEFVPNIVGEMLEAPRSIKFTTGRRNQQWNKNVLCLGLASGFLEPLESTSIYLMLIGITRFIQQFPHSGIEESQVKYYNRIAKEEYESIRDFIILHYKLTEREDTPFWKYMKYNDVPSALADKIQFFKDKGQIYPDASDIFRENSWLQVMIGQGLKPKSYHPIAILLDEAQLKESLSAVRKYVHARVDAMPSHQEFLRAYCPRVTDHEVS